MNNVNVPANKSCMDLDSRLSARDKSRKDLRTFGVQNADLKQSGKYHLQECVLSLAILLTCIRHWSCSTGLKEFRIVGCLIQRSPELTLA
ncbi:hypothetical protein Hanom_Chr12g01114171 [Helianthus anomalus]